MDNQIVVVVKGVVINDGRILILKRSSMDEVKADEWETVGGKIEFGEKLEAALIREIKEEAGIHVSIDKLLYSVTFLTNKSRQIVLLSYLCRTNEAKITLSDEHSDYLWATRSELIRYLPVSIIDDFVKYGVLTMEELIE